MLSDTEDRQLHLNLDRVTDITYDTYGTIW